MSRWVSVGDQDGELEHWTGEEWDQFRAASRLGRMVDNMQPGDMLQICDTDRTYRYYKFSVGKNYRGKSATEALQAGGVSDMDNFPPAGKSEHG